MREREDNQEDCEEGGQAGRTVSAEAAQEAVQVGRLREIS